MEEINSGKYHTVIADPEFDKILSRDDVRLIGLPHLAVPVKLHWDEYPDYLGRAETTGGKRSRGCKISTDALLNKYTKKKEKDNRRFEIFAGALSVSLIAASMFGCGAFAEGDRNSG